jgi:mercuric reductase
LSESAVQHFDFVILGSGSTAFAAALRAADLGKTAALTEIRTLGGTCVNRGCLPSKNLIEAARIFAESAHPRYPGLLPAMMKLDFQALVAQKDELIHEYRDRKYHSLVVDSDKIKVFAGHARFLDARTVVVGNNELHGDRFLIATGASPLKPDFSGLRDTPHLTSDLLSSDEPMELTELPESLICIGGGYISLEIGQLFARFGSKVTILERGPRILARHEPEIGDSVRRAFDEEGITVLTNTQVSDVRGDERQVSVTVVTSGRRHQLTAHRLLVATGRQPNTPNIGLGKAGVITDPHGFVVVNEELQTSQPHIYAAGDVIGSHTGSQLATPVGAQDGGIAAENALSDAHHRVKHAVIPRAVFTDPQVAVVGLSDQEASAGGYECTCRVIPMKFVPRASAVRDTRGVIKMVAQQRSGKVLGVSMHGLNAAEVIHEAAMGLRFGATVNDFAAMLHVYPTMSEALKIVALAYAKDVSKLSCCAE